MSRGRGLHLFYVASIVGISLFLFQNCDGEFRSSSIALEKNKAECTFPEVMTEDCSTSIANSEQASQTLSCSQTDSWNEPSACQLERCKPGYFVDGNVCSVNKSVPICTPGELKDVDCPISIANAEREVSVHTCNAAGDDWNVAACELKACLPTYKISAMGNSCEKIETTPVVKCVDGPSVICRIMTEWPAGTLFWQSIPKGYSHVFPFTYDKLITQPNRGKGSFTFFDGGLKVVSISSKPNDFSLNFPCQSTQKSPLQPVNYGSKSIAEWYECPLEHGKTYFLNVKSTDFIADKDPYTLTVY